MEEECASCGHIITNSDRISKVEPDKHNNLTDSVFMCSICMNSNSGNAFLYPQHYLGSIIQLEMIAQVGNILLDKIEKHKGN